MCRISGSTFILSAKRQMAFNNLSQLIYCFICNLLCNFLWKIFKKWRFLIRIHLVFNIKIAWNFKNFFFNCYALLTTGISVCFVELKCLLYCFMFSLYDPCRTFKSHDRDDNWLFMVFILTNAAVYDNSIHPVSIMRFKYCLKNVVP